MGVEIGHTGHCEIFVEVNAIVDGELDGLNSQIVTLEIPSEILVRNQVL